ESDTRMYYLIADNAPGKRVNTRVLRNQGGNVISNSYAASAVKKERTQYVSIIYNGPENNFFGRVIFSDPTSVPFDLTNIDFSAATCSVTVKLQGFSNGVHNILATLNGHDLGFVTGNDQEAMSATFTGVPTSYLAEGANSLQIA